MRMKSNLKKILSVVLAASVVTTTSALAGLAAGGGTERTAEAGPVSLLPASIEDVQAADNDQKDKLTITFDDNGRMNTKAEPWSWPSAEMVYDPPLQVNINETPILEYLINGDAQEADFTITYTAKDEEHSWTASANPELGHGEGGHADAGTPLGGFDADCNVSEKMGTVDFGAYLAERDRIPEDGIITISKVSYQTMGNNVNDTQESRTGGTNVWSILRFAPDNGEYVNLIPASQEAILPPTAEAEIPRTDWTLEDGKLTVSATGGTGRVTMMIDKFVDIAMLQKLFVDMEIDGRAVLAFTTSGYSDTSLSKVADLHETTYVDMAGRFPVELNQVDGGNRIAGGTYQKGLEYYDMIQTWVNTPGTGGIDSLKWYPEAGQPQKLYVKQLMVFVEPEGSGAEDVGTITLNDLYFAAEEQVTDPEEPTTGTPATPDAPYYSWAATSKPENVEVGFDLLAWADFDSITDSPFVINEDGSVSFTWSSYKSYTMPVGAEVNLEENPYLYWSIEQGTGSRTTFVLHPQDGAPYGIYRSYTDPDNMFITSDNTSSADNYIDGSETGCFNMYEWLNENGYGSLDAKMIKDIVIAASREVDTTINYLFFGPAPTTETEPSETEPTETEPSETEPSQTEPSETEPSETEPTETEPSETEPTQTEPEKPGKTVDLMPDDVSTITNDAGGTAEKQGDSVVFKAGDTDTVFTYPVAVPVNMLETPYFCFGMTSTGTWDISWSSTGLNNDVNPGLSADFGNLFGKTGDPGSNQYGTPIDAGSYAPGDVEIDASGAYTWNGNLPADGIVTMKSISVKVGANSELTLNALYFGSDPTTEPSTDPSTEPSTDPTSEPSTEPSSEPSASDSTGSVTDTTATTAAPTTGNGGNNSPATGENTALAMMGGLLLIGSAGALIFTKKKKVQ